jgi:hypothetical protein
MRGLSLFAWSTTPPETQFVRLALKHDASKRLDASRIFLGFKESTLSIAARRLAVVNSSNWIPESPSMTDSLVPPVAFAITGQPAAIASTGMMPKSSMGGEDVNKCSLVK